MASERDLANRFNYHAPDTERARTHMRIRDVIGGVADFVNAVCPEGREASLALTKLEEAMFWANASIARSGCEPGGAVHRWPWVTHQELRNAIVAMKNYTDGEVMDVQAYAQAVDAETNRLAGVVAELQATVANSDATNAAELAAAFDPVLAHLRSVGVDGPTAPPADGGGTPADGGDGSPSTDG